MDEATARAKAKRLLDRVEELTRANVADFTANPALLRQFWQDFDGGGFVYVLDRWACPEPACWDTYRELRERVPRAPRPWDCKKATAALGAALAVEGVPLALGLRPGERVSHAILGVLPSGSAIGAQPSSGSVGTAAGKDLGADPRIRPLDPSVWTGMQPLTMREYAETYWRKL